MIPTSPCACPLAGWGSHLPGCRHNDPLPAVADDETVAALLRARRANPELRLGQLLVSAADTILTARGVRLGPIPNPLWEMTEAEWCRAFGLLAGDD